MKPKHKRLVLLALMASCLIGAGVLAALAFRDSILYFVSPTDYVRQTEKWVGKNIRVGGLVVDKSLSAEGDASIKFEVTDQQHKITVVYRGLLPNLFREGQGVVAEGAFDEQGIFRAKRILAKHDENYMPPDVARAIKESGQWRGK